MNRAWEIVKQGAARWWSVNPQLLGAALSYYALFALAPLVVLAVSAAGAFFDEKQAREEVAHQIQNNVGPQVAKSIEAVLADASQSAGGSTATVLGVGILAIAAMGLFGGLQEALNAVFGVPENKKHGWKSMIKERFMLFVMIAVIAGLLLAALAATSVFASVQKNVQPPQLWGIGREMLAQTANWIVSMLLSVALFTCVYRLLPSVRVCWTAALPGAAVTALLWNLGNYLIGLYLGFSGATSAYGAAGSAVAVLLWVYYSAQIVLFGAGLTYAMYVQGCPTGIPNKVAEPAQAVAAGA